MVTGDDGRRLVQNLREVARNGLAAAFDAPEDDTLDDRGKLLAALHNGRFLERHDLEALARERDAPWPRFLEQVADQLVRGAQGRTVAKLVASVVYGRETGR